MTQAKYLPPGNAMQDFGSYPVGGLDVSGEPRRGGSGFDSIFFSVTATRASSINTQAIVLCRTFFTGSLSLQQLLASICQLQEKQVT